MWFLFILVLLLLSAFVIVARKGRRLRRNQPLAPAATKAFLRWSENGRDYRLEIKSPFYLGSHEKNDVVLREAKAPFEACIFYHNKRFAIQALEGSEEVLINEMETIASYLSHGDLLRIAQRRFSFECY